MEQTEKKIELIDQFIANEKKAKIWTLISVGLFIAMGILILFFSRELSEKEKAVLDLFEAMTPFEQIAEALDMQRYRVRQIFEKVMRRCGFATRSQLYLALFEAGKANG